MSGIKGKINSEISLFYLFMCKNRYFIKYNQILFSNLTGVEK